MKTDFFASLTLWLVGKKETVKYEAVKGSLSADGITLNVKFSKKLSLKIRSKDTRFTGAIFLTLSFGKTAVSHLPGFDDYKYDSPWNIQVGFYDDRGREVKGRTDVAPVKWQIMRHKKDGEIPSFLWRSNNFISEYDNELDMPK